MLFHIAIVIIPITIQANTFVWFIFISLLLF